MAKISLQKENISHNELLEIRNILKDKIDIIEESHFEYNDVKITTSLYEKYYFRASNAVAATITTIEYNNKIEVDILSAGGANNPIIRFSWGSEEDFNQLLAEYYIKKGFVEIKK